MIEDFGNERRAGRSMLIRSVDDVLRILRLSAQQIDVLHHHDRLLAPHIIPLLLRGQRERNPLLPTQLRSSRNLADLRGDRGSKLACRPPYRRSQRLIRIVDHIHIALSGGVRVVRRLVHHIPLHFHLVPSQFRNVLIMLVLHAPVKPATFPAVKQLARVAPLRLAQIRDLPVVVVPEHRRFVLAAQPTSHSFPVPTNRRIAATSAALAASRARRTVLGPPTSAASAARGSPPPPAAASAVFGRERGERGRRGARGSRERPLRRWCRRKTRARRLACEARSARPARGIRWGREEAEAARRAAGRRLSS